MACKTGSILMKRGFADYVYGHLHRCARAFGKPSALASTSGQAVLSACEGLNDGRLCGGEGPTMSTSLLMCCALTWKVLAGEQRSFEVRVYGPAYAFTCRMLLAGLLC